MDVVANPTDMVVSDDDVVVARVAKELDLRVADPTLAPEAGTSEEEVWGLPK